MHHYLCGSSGVLGVRTHLPFWGTPKHHIKREKTLHACSRIRHVEVVLVLNSTRPPPLSEILYPPLAFHNIWVI